MTRRPRVTPLTTGRAAGTVLTGAVFSGAVAAVAARLAYRGLRRRPPGGAAAWARVNHRGEPVTLLEGPAVTAGAVTAALTAAALSAITDTERTGASRTALAMALAGAGAAAFGTLDDLRGSGKRRGLRGHLGALAHGEVTTGAVKLAGIGAAGGAAALVLRRSAANPLDRVIDAGLIAGGANLINLFDLRPGRAIKVAELSAGLIAAGSALARHDAGGAARPIYLPFHRTGPGGYGGSLPREIAAVAAPAGAALALLGEDLGERAMLGDAGANALGAALGAAAAGSLPRTARIWALAGIAALTGISEKVSFTRVIAATPPLNWLDMLGRRPPAAAARTPVPEGLAGRPEGQEAAGGSRDRSAEKKAVTSWQPSVHAAVASAPAAGQRGAGVRPGEEGTVSTPQPAP